MCALVTACVVPPKSRTTYRRRVFCLCFFFQAEDGIRDYKVTGVQTCALPIFAAFLACLDGMIREGAAGRLEEGAQVVYVSPLKALANDVRKNLLEPLAELRALAQAEGIELPEIRTAVRTGDTPPSERQKMGKGPPHVLGA